VTDFGLARRVQGESKLTVSGQILGTPGFMAPEQARGEVDHVTPAVDIHALGAVLYYLLTGHPPFQADNAIDTLMQTVQEEPVPPRNLNAKVPRDLDTICLKCLRKDPSQRYGSAAEVAADLQRWLSGYAIVARPVSRTQQAWKWVRRNPLTASLSLLTLLSVVALAVISSIAYVRTARSLAVSDQRLYANQLMLASRELDARHRNQALWLLRETGQSHRGWEWHYLMRRCFPEQVVIREEPPNGRLVWPGGQRRLLEDSGTLRNPGDGTWTQPEAFLLRDLSADQRTAVGVDPTNATRVKLLDVVTGVVIRQWTIPVEHLHELVFSEDGQSVIAIWAQGQNLHWRAWRTESGEPGSEQYRESVCFAGMDLSRRWIAGDLVDGDHVRRVVWDADSGAEILRAASVESVIWGWQCMLEQPASDRIIVRDNNGDMEAKLDRPLRVFKLCQSPKGLRLVTVAASEQSATQHHVLQVWRWPGLTLEHTLTLDGQIADASISDDGRWLAAAASPPFGTCQALVWDLDTGELVRTLSPAGAPELQGVVFGREVRFQPGGWELAVRFSTRKGQLLWVVWPDFSGRSVEHYELPIANINGLAISDDGRHVAVRNSSDGNIQIVELEGHRDSENAGEGRAQRAELTKQVLTRPRVPFHYENSGKPWELVTPDGVKVVYTLPEIIPMMGVTNPGQIELQSANGSLIARLTGHVGLVTNLAFNADGTRLATISTSETASGRTSLFGIGVDWDADEFQQSAELKLWDVNNGRLLWTRRGHAGDVTDIAFSPDGRRLASAATPRFGTLYPAAEEGEVLIWDVESGQSLFALRGPSSGFSAVNFSQSGDRLAAVAGNQLWVWDGRALPESQPASAVQKPPIPNSMPSGASPSGVPVWSEDTEFAYLPVNECTAERFETLDRLPRLQSLQILPVTALEDPVRAPQSPVLNNLPPVRRLIMTSFPALDGSCLPAIARSQSLESVSAGQFIESVDFAELAQSPGLRDVDLRGQFGDMAVRGLAALSSLRSVRLEGPLRGDFLSDWGPLTQLESLSLHSPILNSSALSGLSQFPNLKHLELEIATVKADDLRVLGHLSHLESLAIVNLASEDVLLPLLIDLPGLRSLHLTSQPGGTLKLTRRELDMLPGNLEQLQLGIPIVDEGGQPLPRLAVLHYLLTRNPGLDVQYLGKRWSEQKISR